MTESELEVATAWGRLAGTLLLPAGEGPFCAALLVAGSGPTDRDGNNPLLPAPIDNLKRLAQALAAHGVATLRYDKRGVGASACPGLSEEALRFEHLVDDATLLASSLALDERIGRVVLAGHSEGALIAALAADEGRPSSRSPARGCPLPPSCAASCAAACRTTWRGWPPRRSMRWSAARRWTTCPTTWCCCSAPRCSPT